MSAGEQWLTATQCAQRFADGTLTPSALLASLSRRIEQCDPLIGAVLDRVDAGALASAAAASDARWQAGAPLSPLDGVPFAVKANIAIEGLPWHAGIAAYRERRAAQDATVVAQLRAAGLLPMATLNMHEGALGETSQNPAFRDTVNPYDPEHIPGGSSGGSVAAVAAGLLPLTLGTDNMGSVRLPSALCGVVGHKPAHGVLSTEGVVPLCPSLDHVGIHARSVADVRAVMTLLRAVLDPDPGQTLDDPELRPARLLLAPDFAVDPAVGACGLARLAAVGLPREDPRWYIVDWHEIDLARERRAGLLRCERDAGQVHGAVMAAQPEGFSDTFTQLINWGATQPESKVAAADERIADAARRLRGTLERCDLLLMPTTTTVAPRRDEAPPLTLADLTATAAFAGVPAISVPAGRVALPGGSALPAGLQIVARSESALLRWAEALAAPFEPPPEWH
ncbi:MAG: amidase [Pseudomonadota bacterium]